MKNIYISFVGKMFSYLSSQGKRDESTSVDAAKAKEDAKVCLLYTDLSLMFLSTDSILYKSEKAKRNSRNVSKSFFILVTH